MNFKQFCSDILILSEPEIAEQMQAYMRRQFEFLGVPAAARREACLKQFETAKAEGEIAWEFIDACWEQNFREFQYVAIDYLLIMIDFLQAEDIDMIKKYIVSKSWWDTVDILRKVVGHLVLHNRPELNQTMLEWSKSDNLWLRRSAILHQLDFKSDTDRELLSEIVQNNFADEEFFIKKAIGWALRQYSKTDPDWVTDFIHKYKDQLSPLSYREAVKIINSGD